MKKKIIIIGAGVAGLSAGCYGQMNGYDTSIFEMHNIPGGLCTVWNRKGYTFDGCIHWFMGANPDSLLHGYWEEVGALTGKKFINHDIVRQIEGDSGKKLILYSDVDKLEKHLLELSPEDYSPITELTNAVRRFKLSLGTGRGEDDEKFKKMSMEDFSQQFKDPFIREAFLVLASKRQRVYEVVFLLAAYNNKDAGWPVGGSLEFARGIETRYLELLGSVQYNEKVEEIIIKDNRAVGIRLSNGALHKADFVISAVDGYATIFNMLKGKYITDEIKPLYEDCRAYPTSIQVSLGVDFDLSEEPHCVSVKLVSPFNVGGFERTHLQFKHYCYDNTMCLHGKSVVTTIIPTGYDYWEKLYKEPKTYKEEKEKIAGRVIAAFEDRFSYAKGKIEVVDVATPVTYNRYTGVWKGAYMGRIAPKYTIPCSLPGLEGFYMAGQWTHPIGGLPTALMTGRGSIMSVCKDDGREFTANSKILAMSKNNVL